MSDARYRVIAAGDVASLAALPLWAVVVPERRRVPLVHVVPSGTVTVDDDGELVELYDKWHGEGQFARSSAAVVADGDGPFLVVYEPSD